MWRAQKAHGWAPVSIHQITKKFGHNECKETARIFRREFSKKFHTGVQRVALRKLVILDAAETLQELRIPPLNRIEKLSDDRREQHSIRINDQWRICFRWKEADAYDVEIVDYH